jgi:hypothetical protein
MSQNNILSMALNHSQNSVRILSPSQSINTGQLQPSVSVSLPPPLPFKLISQKIELDIKDFDKELIDGSTTFTLSIKASDKKINIPIHGKQLIIKEISIDKNPIGIKISHLEEATTPQKQAMGLKEILSYPSSLEEYFTGLSTFELSSDFSQHDKLYSVEITNEFDSSAMKIENSEDNEAETLKFDLKVTFRLVKPVSGLRFFRYKRNSHQELSENFLYTDPFNGSGKMWCPSISATPFVSKLK